MAVCKSCGTEVTGKFCPACGEPVNLNIETDTYINNSTGSSMMSEKSNSLNTENSSPSSYAARNQGNNQTYGYAGQSQETYQSSGYTLQQQNSYVPPQSRPNTHTSGHTYYAEKTEKPVEYVNWLLSIIVVNIIPIIGTIVLIVWCFDKESESKRNWARAYLTTKLICWFLIIISWTSMLNFLSSVINNMSR